MILAAGLSLAAGALIGWAVADWMQTRAAAREQHRTLTDRLRLVDVMTKTATPRRK